MAPPKTHSNIGKYFERFFSFQFNLHEGEMRAWLTFKRERAARLAREARNRNAATRVQSWWRGEMVRRGLGPFKFLRHVKKSATTSSATKSKKK